MWDFCFKMLEKSAGLNFNGKDPVERLNMQARTSYPLILK